MSDDKLAKDRHIDQGKPISFNRFSDKLAVVSLGTIVSVGSYLVSNTWKLRGELEKLIETERVKTTQQSANTREYAERRIQEYHQVVKEDLGEIKDEIRDMRAQILRLYGDSK